MISIFHPSSLFCPPEEWINPDFQDSFTEHLIKHLQRAREFNIKIAMSSDFESYFWENIPWNSLNSSGNFSKTKLLEIFHRMQERFEIINPPPETACQIEPDIQNGYWEDSRILWLILIHRLLFNKMETLVIIGNNIEDNINYMDVFCNCDHERTHDKYTIIKRYLDWYVKINYMEKCPNQLDSWEEDFRIAVKMCREQEPLLSSFNTNPENIYFYRDFKKKFLDIQDQSKRKRIIKSITKLLTLNHQEAGRDGGLQEEIINGKYRIRISQGERIHYIEEDGKKIFLDYNPSSRHDTGL